MKNTGERRSVFKKGKGRAFLRFLLGELLLIALVAVCYLFLLQGDISSLLPAPVSVPEATATPAPTEVPAPTPTAVVTIAPTQEPTPAPTGTPIPFEELSLPAGEDAPEVPALPDELLKLGMSEFRAFTDGGQKVMLVSGYAYIEGLDAAKSSIYLLVSNAADGSQLGMYPAVSAPETASLSFEESSGSNLANAFFTAKLDVSEFGDNAYLLSAVVVNEDKVSMNFFDSRTFHFTIWDGELSVVE